MNVKDSNGVILVKMDKVGSQTNIQCFSFQVRQLIFITGCVHPLVDWFVSRSKTLVNPHGALIGPLGLVQLPEETLVHYSPGYLLHLLAHLALFNYLKKGFYSPGSFLRQFA